MAPWQEEKQAFIRSLAHLRARPDRRHRRQPGARRGADRGQGGARAFRRRSGSVRARLERLRRADVQEPLRLLRWAVAAGTPTTITISTPCALELFFEDELGWLDLNNAARAIEIRGTRIEFFGTGDAHRGWDKLAALPGAIEELRENVEWSAGTDEQVLRIGVTHAPYQRVLNSFVNQGADVIFAGHTHGGQVRIPGLPRARHQLRHPARSGAGAEHLAHGPRQGVPRGLGRHRHLDLRARALRLPARGGRAHARRRRGVTDRRSGRTRRVGYDGQVAA